MMAARTEHSSLVAVVRPCCVVLLLGVIVIVIVKTGFGIVKISAYGRFHLCSVLYGDGDVWAWLFLIDEPAEAGLTQSVVYYY